MRLRRRSLLRSSRLQLAGHYSRVDAIEGRAFQSKALTLGQPFDLAQTGLQTEL